MTLEDLKAQILYMFGVPEDYSAEDAMKLVRGLKSDAEKANRLAHECDGLLAALAEKDALLHAYRDVLIHVLKGVE